MYRYVARIFLGRIDQTWTFRHEQTYYLTDVQFLSIRPKDIRAKCHVNVYSKCQQRVE